MKQLQIDFNSPDTACTIPCVSVTYLSDGKTCSTCYWWKKILEEKMPNTKFNGSEFPCYNPHTVKQTFGEMSKKATDSCERWQYER